MAAVAAPNLMATIGLDIETPGRVHPHSNFTRRVNEKQDGEGSLLLGSKIDEFTSLRALRIFLANLAVKGFPFCGRRALEPRWRRNGLTRAVTFTILSV